MWKSKMNETCPLLKVQHRDTWQSLSHMQYQQLLCKGKQMDVLDLEQGLEHNYSLQLSFDLCLQNLCIFFFVIVKI